MQPRLTERTSPILVALFAIFLGSTLDAIVRIATEEHGLLALMMWRYLFAALALALPYIWWLRRYSKPLPDRSTLLFYLLRGAVQAAMTYSFFWGLTQLPLAEATTLGFSSALLVAPLEALLLREKLRPLALGAALLGFLGVLVIVGFADAVPRADTNPALGRIACMAAAVFYALSLLMLRVRSQKDDRFTVATLFAVAGAFWYALPYLYLQPALSQGGFGWAGLLALLGTMVWYLMGEAYARAPAHVLAPLEYSSFLWAAAFGYVLFSEVPSPGLAAGAVIIIAAALMLYVDDRRLSGRPPLPIRKRRP